MPMISDIAIEIFKYKRAQTSFDISPMIIQLKEQRADLNICQKLVESRK